jgi:glycosyltransferase involved in cell wall biosynthesis
MMDLSFDQKAPLRISVIAPYTAALAIYIIKPLTELEKQGKVKLQLYSNMSMYNSSTEIQAAIPLHEVISSDLIVFCRNNQIYFDYLLEETIAHNIPTLYVLDDNFWILPNYIPGFFSSDRTFQQFERFLRYSRFIWVYNPIVYKNVLQYNSNVQLAIAGIDLQLAKRAFSREIKGQRIKIAYVSSRGPKDSLLNVITPALIKILEKYHNQVELDFWGETPEAFKPHPQVISHAIDYDYDHFLSSISSAGYDIGLAPTFLDDFHLSKTNTKFRDYGACRIAGIYTNSPIYSEIQDGQTGLLVENTDEAWFNAIERLINENDLRTRIQENAFQYIQERYDQIKMIREWEDFFAQLIKTKPSFELQHSGQQRRFSLNPTDSDKQLYMGQSHQESPDFSDYLEEFISPLPFPDNFFNLIVLDHVIEAVPALNEFMQEIYRISQPGAQICILSYYATNMQAIGNPNISNWINEHTPRYWSRGPAINLFAEDVSLANLSEWSLQPKSSLTSSIDLRCFRMKFFYGSKLQGLFNHQRREARHNQINVCDTIMMHLVCLKGTVNEDEMKEKISQVTPFVPPASIIRDLNEQKEELLLQLQQYQSKESQINANLQVENEKLKKINDQLQDANNQLQGVYNWATLYAKKSAQTSIELKELRGRKIYRLLDRLFNRQNLEATLGPNYRQLIDDSRIFNPKLNEYLLQISDNLQGISYLSFFPALGGCRLKGILFAPIIDFPFTTGRIGIEIVINNNIFPQSILPAENLNEIELAQVTFDPINVPANARVEIRVFAREVDMPLRILEWRKYFFLGLSKIHHQPFFGYMLDL